MNVLNATPQIDMIQHVSPVAWCSQWFSQKLVICCL